MTAICDARLIYGRVDLTGIYKQCSFNAAINIKSRTMCVYRSPLYMRCVGWSSIRNPPVYFILCSHSDYACILALRGLAGAHEMLCNARDVTSKSIQCPQCLLSLSLPHRKRVHLHGG